MSHLDEYRVFGPPCYNNPNGSTPRTTTRGTQHTTPRVRAMWRATSSPRIPLETVRHRASPDPKFVVPRMPLRVSAKLPTPKPCSTLCSEAGASSTSTRRRPRTSRRSLWMLRRGHSRVSYSRTPGRAREREPDDGTSSMGRRCPRQLRLGEIRRPLFQLQLCARCFRSLPARTRR